MQRKLNILLSSDVTEARSWIGRRMSILASHQREDIQKQLPDVVNMTTAQLERYLYNFQQKWQVSQQSQQANLAGNKPTKFNKYCKTRRHRYSSRVTVPRKLFPVRPRSKSSRDIKTRWRMQGTTRGCRIAIESGSLLQPHISTAATAGELFLGVLYNPVLWLPGQIASLYFCPVFCCTVGHGIAAVSDWLVRDNG